MATMKFFLLLAAISLTAVCARPQDESENEISNYIPLGDEPDIPLNNTIDITTIANPETSDSQDSSSTESVSSTEESTTTTAPPRTSFFSRLIDDIVKIPGTVLKALNSFINNLGFRSTSSSSSSSSSSSK